VINLEQVKLLETKVSRVAEYVERLTGENTALVQKEVELQTRLESYQKRIDELEVLILQFKEDQGRIEDGILAALDRLNQFENAIEKSLKNKESKTAAAPKTQAAKPEKKTASPDPAQSAVQPTGEKIFFEIPEAESGGDVEDPLTDEAENSSLNGQDTSAENRELEIF
jgi:peptidoglycan hydrolase CwlO-like protein